MKISFFCYAIFFLNVFTQSAYLDFEIKKITPEEAHQLSIPNGVLITKIGENSSLKKNGVKVYDIILTFDEEKVNSATDIQRHLNTGKVGQKIILGILRKGKRLSIKTVLEERISDEFVQFDELNEKKGTPFLDLNDSFDMEDIFKKAQQNNKIFSKKGINSFLKKNFSSTRRIIDDKHDITISDKNGEKFIVIRDRKRKIIFQGKINTKDELDKIPKLIRKKVLNLL